MRLAFIKKKFSVHGGAERYLQTLLTDLKRRGHEIHVYANAWPGGKNDIIFHKVEIFSAGSFFSTVTFNRNVRKAIEKGTRPDCVISFERTTCQDIYRAGEGCHAEWLEIRSQVEPYYKRLSFKMNPLHIALLNLEKRLFSDTRTIIANSEMVKAQIMKHYAVPEERITIIYNGVDLSRFSPANKDKWRAATRKSLGISDSSKVLLFVGSGFKRKGLKTLIDAVSLMKREDLKILVIGKGDAAEYVNIAAGYGIADKFVFLGAQSGIEKFYAASDLFILPTLYDPFSNATLEAMASGLPVITSGNNGVAELIEEGREGFVLERPTDMEELAVRTRLSLDRLDIMGKKAREKAEQFPIEAAAGRFLNIIDRTMS